MRAARPAQHGKTALVADHDAESVSAALDKNYDGSFVVDRDLYEDIRRLTRDDAKCSWMMGVPLDPDAARRSVLRTDPERILRDLARVAPWVHCVVPVATLFGLTRGQELSVPDAGVCRVDDIRLESETSYLITLKRDDARPLLVALSTAPMEKYYRKTPRGHYLSHRDDGLTPTEFCVVDQVGRLL